MIFATIAVRAQTLARWLLPAQSRAEVRAVYVAFAQSQTWSTWWLSLEVRGAGARGLLVLPVRAGSTVDWVGDAWFGALESSTAPQVLPPIGEVPPDCGAGQAKAHDTADGLQGDTLVPTSLVSFSTAEQLREYAGAQGFELETAAVGAFDAPSDARAFVVLSFEFEPEWGSTQTIRIRVPGAAPEVPLSSLIAIPGDWEEGASPDDGSQWTPVDVRLYEFGAGRGRLEGLTELPRDEVSATWLSSRGQSDYPGQLRVLLEPHQGTASLVECSAAGPLWSYAVLPGGVTLAPLAQRYLTEAKRLGDTQREVRSCLAELWRMRVLPARVSETCGAGDIVRLAREDGTDPCVQTATSAEQIDAERLRCSGADELAYALSGLVLQEARVTRHRLLIAERTPPAAALTWHDADELSPVVRTSEVDAVGCVLDADELDEAGSGGPSGVTGGSARQQVPTGDDDPSVTERDDDSGCNGSTEPESDSTIIVEISDGPTDAPDDEGADCSSDSSDEASEESCSGDTTDDSSSDGNSCSGDTHDSESKEETCSGDSTSSSEEADGATCGGDAEAGDDGATCGGDAEDSSGDCRVSRRRLPRIRLSALTFAVLAVCLPLRRRSRRRVRSRRPRSRFR